MNRGRISCVTKLADCRNADVENPVFVEYLFADTLTSFADPACYFRIERPSGSKVLQHGLCICCELGRNTGFDLLNAHTVIVSDTGILSMRSSGITCRVRARLVATPPSTWR